MSLCYLLTVLLLAKPNPTVQTDAIKNDKAFSYSARNYNHLLGLEGFSDELLTQHFELYKGYVTQTNLLNDKLKNLISQAKIDASVISAIKKAYAFEYNGMKLHELFFENLEKNSSLDQDLPVYRKLAQDFGSFEMWKKDFIQTGLTRGIGWVICFYDAVSGKLTNVWVESHDKGVPVFDNIILVMDCWEHAYLNDFGIKRQTYIETFFNAISWNVVQSRFSSTKSL